MGTTELHAAEQDRRSAAFGHIVCGVNASRADADTVCQAALLSGADGKLEIFCVVDSRGFGATEQSSIASPRVDRALEQARHNARDLGVQGHTCILHGSSPWESLASAAKGADLLVLGTHPGSRAEGIVLGRVATEAIHRAELSVLLTRHVPGVTFPATILVASDGAPGSRPAVDMAVAIARMHGSEITLLTAGEVDAHAREEIAEQAATIAFLTGRDPARVSAEGPARAAIERHARSERPSLVVVGSSGKLGVKALGSVSEHVAHNVPSSVLVARTRWPTPHA